MIYKLQIYTEEADAVDFYFDVTKIDGFIITILEEDEEPRINIFFNGDYATIKQEPHIVEYLTKRFVNEAVV